MESNGTLSMHSHQITVLPGIPMHPHRASRVHTVHGNIRKHTSRTNIWCYKHLEYESDIAQIEVIPNTQRLQ